MAIQGGLSRVTTAVSERLPEVYDAIRERLRSTADYPPGADDGLSTVEADTISTSLQDVLEYLAVGGEMETRISNATLREVRMAARAGVTLQALLQGSRTAQATLWEFVLEEAYHLIDDPSERIAVLRNASANHFAWNNAIAGELVDAYNRENTAYARRSGNRRTLAVVRSLLAGLPVDTAGLDHPLTGSHLAAVIQGPAAGAVLDALSSMVPTRPLAVSLADGELWLWFPWSARTGSARDAFGGVSLAPGTRLAFGSVAAGPDGFRLSHRQAVEAATVATALDRPVVWYSDVVLEAHVLHDLGAVRQFVDDELAPLGGVKDPDNVLIETLRAYYSHGQNSRLTARSLMVHNRTVAYRLRSIESRLGKDALRRDECAVAVRLFALVTALRDRPEAVTRGTGLPDPGL